MNDGKNETQLLKEILTTVNNTSQQVTNISRIIGELKVRQEYIDKDHERVVEQQKITSHDISKLKSDRDHANGMIKIIQFIGAIIITSTISFATFTNKRVEDNKQEIAIIKQKVK